jgi:hypothetical protein
MKEEALAEYGRTALKLHSVWRKPKDYPPGFAADVMSDFVQLSQSLHRTDAKERSVETVLAELRQQPTRALSPHN